MSKNIVTQITLDCLVNQNVYNNTSSKNTHSFKKDMKFYKRRIYSLVKDILSNNLKDKNMPPDVNEYFNLFSKSCIDYFKTLDSNDIIQEEYDSLLDESVNNKSSTTICSSDSNSILKCDNKINSSESDILLMKTIGLNEKRVTMDNFVIHHKQEVDTIFLPKERIANLKDPHFKSKGIKSKPLKVKQLSENKNIDKKYEEDQKNDKKNQEIEKKENNGQKQQNKTTTINKS